MEKREHTGEPVAERRPLDVPGAAEEDISTADAAERLDLDPEEQVNRPDQPDAAPDERRKSQGSIAEADHPEDC